METDIGIVTVTVTVQLLLLHMVAVAVTFPVVTKVTWMAPETAVFADTLCLQMW